jgi:thiol-disulfide isomerase/thioredoxin
MIKEEYLQTIRLFKKDSSSPNSISKDSLEALKTNLFQELPHFDLISIESDTVKVKDLKSKYILFDFWYRSCYPCIKSIPVLNKLHSEYNESKLKIISINNIDKSVSLINDFIEHNHIEYDVYTQSVQKGNSFDGINSYPFFILYDENFKIIKHFSGYSEKLYEEIVEHLK